MKTPIEVLEDYPHIAQFWTPNDIGYLLRMKLIRGKKLIRGCVVYAEDVNALFDSYFKK